MTYAIRAAQQADCGLIEAHLGESSRLAYGASGHPEALKVLLAAYGVSEGVCTVVYEDRPVAMFGAIPLPDQGATLWLAAVELTEPLPASLIKQARRFVARYLDAYEWVRTIVWQGSPDHVRWVEWLGFKQTGINPYGPHGELFHAFILGKHNGN